MLRRIIILLIFISLASELYCRDLQFGENGKFVIAHITDSHIKGSMNPAVKDFINRTLDYIKPDLVILGGDLCTGTQDTQELEIHELCDIFVSAGVYFTLTFGNHDSGSGMENEKLLALYKKYGKEYCLLSDPFPEISGCGNQILPILSSDGTDVMFNLYLLDSGDYVQTDDGKIHYSSVKADQVRWLQDVYDKNYPSFIFQHIIVQDVYDSLFWRIHGKSSGKFIKHFDGDKYYFCIPKIYRIKDGFVLEKPCPGFYNHGEFDAIVDLNKKSSNPVLAVFSGHDHSNSFRIRYKNIDLVNTASAKPARNFIKNINRGCRIITLNENKITKYRTYTLTYVKLKICIFFRTVADLWHALSRSRGSSSTGCISDSLE